MQPLFQDRFQSVGIGGFVYVVVALVGTIIAAVLSYELYERRWLKLKSKFAGDEAKPAPAAS